MTTFETQDKAIHQPINKVKTKNIIFQPFPQRLIYLPVTINRMHAILTIEITLVPSAQHAFTYLQCIWQCLPEGLTQISK